MVDNDPAGSAREGCGGGGRSQVRYALESVPGISSARNRVLDEAHDADVLVFLDDDETRIPTGWRICSAPIASMMPTQ